MHDNSYGDKEYGVKETEQEQRNLKKKRRTET